MKQSESVGLIRRALLPLALQAEAPEMTLRGFAVILGLATDQGDYMTAYQPDLAEVIIDFVEALPATVSADTLFFVIPYAFAQDPGTEIEGFVPIVCEKLRANNAIDKMGAVVRIIGALDHVLWRTIANLEHAKETTLPGPGIRQEIFDRLSARYPLEKRHLSQTWAKWTRLRDVQLTRQNLVDYENSLLLSRFQKK